MRCNQELLSLQSNDEVPSSNNCDFHIIGVCQYPVNLVYAPHGTEKNAESRLQMSSIPSKLGLSFFPADYPAAQIGRIDI